MSTKDISRSALEGGRANTYERNRSHRHERSRAKVWLDAVRFDSEVAEDSVPEPREPVNKEFTDKLNPCYRWLASRKGKPWAEVFSELTSKFDTRKLSSWHIVNQHMLTSVQGAGSSQDGAAGFFRAHRFFIDEEGLLQDNGKHSYTYQHKVPYSGPSEASAMAYAKGRRVIDAYGDVQRWAIPNNAGEWQECERLSRCNVSLHDHWKVETTSVALIAQYGSPGYRSLGEGDWWRTFVVKHFVAQTWRKQKNFTKAETKWWKSLSYDIRSKLYIRS